MAQDTKKLSIGVVGLGYFGTHHVRVYSELKQVDKLYVYDIDSQKRTSIASLYNAIPVDSLDELANVSDAVSIATLTHTHAQIGEEFLNKKIPCLIEKPLAVTKDECARLINKAKKNNTLLMVGHIEHYNPAFLELKKILKQGVKILSIDARRLSYASSRQRNVDVIFDLMIHDIDLILSLVGSDLEIIGAGNVEGHHDEWGHVVAMLRDKNGVLVNLTASRITQNKIRTLCVTTDIGWFQLDFIKQELLYYQGGSTKKPTTPDNLSYTLDLSMEKIFVRNQEPLTAELKHFVDCVGGNDTPLVTGESGYNAVKVAIGIRDAIEKKRKH